MTTPRVTEAASTPTNSRCCCSYAKYPRINRASYGTEAWNNRWSRAVSHHDNRPSATALPSPLRIIFGPFVVSLRFPHLPPRIHAYRWVLLSLIILLPKTMLISCQRTRSQYDVKCNTPCSARGHARWEVRTFAVTMLYLGTWFHCEYL